MLWMALFLPSLSLEREPAPANLPCAVVNRRRGRRIVLACNTSAHAAGIETGIDAVAALAREPTLRLIERSPSREARALAGLANWALQFSAEVCLDASRWLLWMEVGGSTRYFGGLPALTGRIEEGIAALGFTAHSGVAPTLEGAAILAREARSGIALDRPALLERLGPGELGLLALDPEVVTALRATGLRTIAEALALPAAALARRFGPEVPLYLRQLTGELPDPRPRHRAPDRYRRDHDCTCPIATVEGLLFPLRRLLQELEGFLRGRDLALQHLAVTLQHRDAARTMLHVRTSSPQREAVRLFALLRERLERTVLPEAVTGIRLATDELLAPAIRQEDFFDQDARPNEDWTALLDRLRARLGETAVRRLGLADDHRPERAWVQGGAAADLPFSEDYPDRPLWLLEAQPVERLPVLCGTPERIEAGWWAGEDSSRDYYLARTPEGARWWLYRDVRTSRWYLQGIWS